MEEGPVEEEVGDDEDGGENHTDSTSQITRIQRKSPMELLVMCAPLIHVTCLVYPGLYFVSLDLPIVLISIVPKESRNFFIISLCLALDTLIISVFLAWGTYVVFTIVSFVLTLTDTVDLAIHRLSIT